MTLGAGDLTTPARANLWMGSPFTLPAPILTQLVTSMSALIYSKLNRARTFNQTFTRVLDGVGTMQLVLPDYPVTSINSIYQGSRLLSHSLIVPRGVVQPANTVPNYGYRYSPWDGMLPGAPCVVEFANGFFYAAPQNITVNYQAGYLINGEAQIIPPSPGPYTITALQPLGLWCKDVEVTYTSGVQLIPVTTGPPMAGMYVPPTDANPGVYTFSAGDAGLTVMLNYSFVPADLEEACIQMVAERVQYQGRVGQRSKSLGGQETMSYRLGLPSEVADMIWPYVSVIPPAIGAPV